MPPPQSFWSSPRKNTRVASCLCRFQQVSKKEKEDPYLLPRDRLAGNSGNSQSRIGAAQLNIFFPFFFLSYWMAWRIAVGNRGDISASLCEDNVNACVYTCY